MYGESLNDGYADVAPAAFDIDAQQNQYDIEMDRYQRQSKVASNSHGHGGGNGFDNAVYIGDDDANSVQDDVNSLELNNDKAVPNMALEQIGHYRSGSIRDVDSPRDVWASNPNSPDPTKGLTCLFWISALVAVCAIAAATTIDNGMMNIMIDMDAEGTFQYNLGWVNAQLLGPFNYEKDQARQYQTAKDAAPFFPIPNTKIYMENAGYLLIATALITLALVVYIDMVLCSRRNSHILLYINCCCCRIPQRASIYFALDIVKTFVWIVTMYYIVLAIYGLLETNFYLTSACPPGNTCWSYIVPHYGFAAIMFIVFAISCCAFSKVQGLDVKFDLKSMQLYYPENLRKAESRNCSLKLDMLFSCISAIKNICILSFVMFVSFRDVGLIAICFYNQTDSTPTNAVMYFQFLGLSNELQSVGSNSYLGQEDLDDNTMMTTISPSDGTQTNNNNQSASFESIAQFLGLWICCILLIDLFVFLPYIWFVISKYRSIGLCKFIIVLTTFIQWLIYTILLMLYFWEFQVFFHNISKPQWQQDLKQNTQDDFNIIWYTDWGIFIALILWFYMLRLMYAAFKAM